MATDSSVLPLPRLRIDGVRIVDPLGVPRLLRGVNRSGLEYTEPFVPLPPGELEHIASDWHANIVRVPFNQDWVLRGRGDAPPEDYLRLLDDTIERAAALGMYTLLDLQWLDADRPFGPNRQFVPPLPNPDTPRLWATLARRYGTNPAVLFDLFNEPHDRAPDDPWPLYRPDGSLYPPAHRRVSIEEWQPWAELLIDTVRADAPDTLLFISGVNWGYDLRGFPLRRDGIVYSAHVYPKKDLDWFTAFGHLADTAPVFAGEFGGGGQDLAWGRSLLDYLDDLSLGWTAWSFADHPHLCDRSFTPTRFGELVRDRLRRATAFVA